MFHLVLGSGSTTQCASAVQEAKDDGQGEQDVDFVQVDGFTEANV